jgi:hypothetical protein
LDTLTRFRSPTVPQQKEKVGRNTAFPEEILCINRRTRTDPHERILFVGGVNNDRTHWKLALDEAIAGIKNGKWTFWTMGSGKRTDVIVATHNGNEYLKTRADGVQPDNLLALPDCP